MDPNKALNMTMLCDFYELTMGNGYLEHGMQGRITYFDVFFRSVPDDGGYAIAAGLEQIIDYIENLHFTDEDIAYLRSRKLFSEAFLDYLKNFRFTGDIWAVPEGTPVFPREPLITVRAPAIQAQLVETYLLLQINHQSLIATKASRICRAAQGRTVLEFGSRRAQGYDGAPPDAVQAEGEADADRGLADAGLGGRDGRHEDELAPPGARFVDEAQGEFGNVVAIAFEVFFGDAH